MKKYLLVLMLVIGAFMAGRFSDTLKKQFKKLKVQQGKWPIITIAIVSLLFGIIIGKGPGILKRLVKAIPHLEIKGAMPFKPRKALVLSDFESESDLKRWKTRHAGLELSSEHAIKGKYSGKMIFAGGVESSNVLMENFFEDNPAYGNWANYSQLKFDIYNAGDSTERIILKIKDADDTPTQRSLFLAPKDTTEVKIYVSELKGEINASKVRQLNLFRWQPNSEAIFYIDNVRLIPQEQAEPAAGQGEDTTSDSQEVKKNQFLFDEKTSDFGIGIASSAEKVFLEPKKFKGLGTDTMEISLAGNEYESSQLVIYAKKPLEKIEIETNDLIAHISGKEVKFDKNNIKCYVVGYVRTRKPGYSVSYVGWWPDPLEEKAVFNLKENTLQPIWVEAYAPADLPAGEYSGTISLKSADAKLKDIKIKIKVRNFSLPKETHLKTAFDFYIGRLRKMYPQREGETQEAYQSRISELAHQYYLDMIKHRIMPIFNFDLTDNSSQKYLKLYLDKGLSAFAIGNYNGSSDSNWPKETDKLNALIDVYREYGRILRASNLMDKAYLYTYDEPKYGDPHVAEVAKMVHKADPQLKNMVCLHMLDNPDKYPGWGDDIDIWCLRNVTFNEKMAKAYMDKGKDVWIYVSGPEPPYPTLVIDYPAMSYRIIPWMCWKYGIKGYLSWCVNFWEENPWQNPMNTKWEQNGNGFLYYPGKDAPVSSIRLEVTRDGLEDYEYLYLLQQKIKAVKDKNMEAENQELLKKAEALLTIDNAIASSMSDYTKDPQLINKRRDDIAKMIESLNSVMEGKYTQAEEYFSKPIEAANGKQFGEFNQLTFELYRGGTFVINGESGFAWQKSDSYLDSAIIRSSRPLPKAYKISAVVGDIDYDLDKIEGLQNDPQYAEGPRNENGAYLLAITDEAPVGHHTNDWWHQHRKVCIDVDNNVWGTGMPHPIFMVYFDKNNELGALNGIENRWQKKWEKALTYEPKAWYRVEIEKSESNFTLYVYDNLGKLLKGGIIPFKYVWNEDGNHPDYLVVGDPHENYYQGSMKIKSISMPVEKNETR